MKTTILTICLLLFSFTAQSNDLKTCRSVANYFNENSSQPYCEIVIFPKVSKVRAELNKYFR